MDRSLIIIILLAFCIILLAVLIILLVTRTSAERQSDILQDNLDSASDILLSSIVKELDTELEDFSDLITGNVEGHVGAIRQDINARLRHDSEENRKNRIEVSDMISRSSALQSQALRECVKELQDTNRAKLSEMQTDINRKLDSSLNERLDASFKNVGEQLNRLYESLGELSKLENGVNSLNRTLSNVKTRGIFGEAQLENILSNILSESLYDKNVLTKKSDPACKERVEFAIKIPDKDTPGSFMYLPIDSKFPVTIYEKICEAAEASDPDALQRAVKELEQHIRQDARDIYTKYIDPPNTTDFAIMFIPTESLYAEILRIPGLAEECQNRCHIVITGPTTIAALVNSLSIGFRYMAVNRDSQNILKLLSAVKTQYGKLSELIDTANTRIELAKKATDELHRRTDIINRKLTSVEELDAREAQSLLGLNTEPSVRIED